MLMLLDELIVAEGNLFPTVIVSELAVRQLFNKRILNRHAVDRWGVR